jgi:predicted dehydrogenase
VTLARSLTTVFCGESGIHHLDALSYSLDKRINSVLAESFTMRNGQLPRGGSMHMLLSLENGTRAVYSSTYESSGHEFFERGQEFYAR